jgi:hypothetical protein
MAVHVLKYAPIWRPLQTDLPILVNLSYILTKLDRQLHLRYDCQAPNFTARWARRPRVTRQLIQTPWGRRSRILTRTGEGPPPLFAMHVGTSMRASAAESAIALVAHVSKTIPVQYCMQTLWCWSRRDAPTPSTGKGYTLSMAVAASCIENAQNLQLATLLAGQIARAAAIFNVDEVVVLDDAEDKVEGQVSAAAALFARVLQFMETPQYLKK